MVCLCGKNECDECFAKVWDQYTTQLDLCKDCGVPRVLTELTDEVFKPCEVCKPRASEFLFAQGLCPDCFTELDEGLCSYCVCGAPVDYWDEDGPSFDYSQCVCKSCTQLRAEDEAEAEKDHE